MRTITLSLKRHRGKLCIFIFFDYNLEIITLLKSKTPAHWSNSKRAWYLPFTNENKNLLLNILSKFRVKNNIFDNHLDLTEEQKKFLNGYYLFLKGKRYSKSTVKTYTHFIALFVNHYKVKELNTLSNLDVRKFIEDVFLKRNYSISTQRQFISAVKLFCNYFPECNITNLELTRPKKSKKLPVVLSQKEVISIIRVTKNLKHRAIITLLYSSGIRISELLALKLADINIERRQLRIVNAKGRKDRYVILAENFIPLLLNYYHTYQPKEFLFENLNKNQYSASSVRKLIKKSCALAGILKNVTPHTFRHSFATHLLEDGVNLRYIQDLLGHSKPETTMVYTQVTQKSLLNIKSPLDQITKNTNINELEQKFLLSGKFHR
ncbi:integrase [Tenacibaculum sp. SZ-18]|uniref:site-specific tyrosine recombinase/integron integrase n=1 Tax=Tenacibaculum sp. SZ-18 TaxID=754423 RepID=UPI000C2D4F28|nr:site-specific tyrosine recombinase/integron integrase [Tenacibaculum sp. SZ-18]AUC15761.1 integrase [Tenacibaculum sp. SZ-18]